MDHRNYGSWQFLSTFFSKGRLDTAFVHDGDGNRVKKTANGETLLYVNKYYEKNLSTNVTTTNYFLGGRLVAQRESSTLRYVHQDHLTGTSVMSDSSGTLVSSISYAAFGDRRISQGTMSTDKLFTGQRLDSTGLYYYGGRYYDPSIGRFISPDTFVQRAEGFDVVSTSLTVNSIPQGLGSLTAPQGNYPLVTIEAPTNPQMLNRYSYVVNNPLRHTDPFGWWTFGIGINFQISVFGWSFSASVMIATSGEGELGVVFSGGGGGGAGYQPNAPAGAGGGIAIQAQFIPNADSIEELRGPAVQIGGSGGKGAYGGAEYVVGETYQGVNVQGGLGIGFEMHGIVEKSGVWVSPWRMPWETDNSASSAPSLPVENEESLAIPQSPDLSIPPWYDPWEGW